MVPVFIAECTQPSARATLVSANVLMITGGQLISYVVNSGLAFVPGTWRWMLGIAAAPAALQLLGLRKVPETPHWLLRKVRRCDAGDLVLKQCTSFVCRCSLASRTVWYFVGSVMSTLLASGAHALTSAKRQLFPQAMRQQLPCMCRPRCSSNSLLA